ncbi:hypothetical protein [Streptomyces sp. NPDC058548]|uniref:hypothetical protein n=1 Tax=Streptomyces sp. NPDC058548 TaxID=3346545 RepID=UPI00365AFAF0
MPASLATEVPSYVTIGVSVVRTVPHLHPPGDEDPRPAQVPTRTAASEFRQRSDPRHATLAV